ARPTEVRCGWPALCGIVHGPYGAPPSGVARRRTISRPAHRDFVGLAQERGELVKCRVARIEHAYPVIGSVDGVGQEPVELGEIVLTLSTEQGAVCRLAHADVEPEDAVTVEVGCIVELAIVLGHDGREGKPVRLG